MPQARGGEGAPPATIRWRGIAPGLWVARRDGRHLGAVQRGRLWTALDADSETIGTYRSFAEAQSAVAQPDGVRPQPSPRGGWGALLFVGAMCFSAALLLGIWPLMPL